MVKTNQQIHDEILAHVRQEGSLPSNWYVGIACQPTECLFNRHCVPAQNSWWIYRQAASSEDARVVEKFLLDTYKFDGGGGGGDNETLYVYAYKKIPLQTKQ